ncbi:retinoblastoma-like protein 2 [Pleuronectes platessa]|uniref:retinoblastoma-like protein 2 n=1 Tax=Pleuronectes platessa TaxID=8262 RepID=UPI00232A4A01|nr:retinoblastoma-like protein 2 [Pleuronectes platessa]XP_053279556.1 retinoblastoma-like protein 2 [Pleuronectes platessa]
MATEPRGNPQWFGPSDHLMSMFRTCSRDPAEAVQARLRRMLHTFLLQQGDRSELAARCCHQAEFWYYRILENLVRQERRRLGVSDVSGIFEADLVQRCLVACCLQISICLNHLPCDLPQLLQILQMKSHHFWRVIELVLRAEAGLPHAVIRHLTQVEENVLESLAWTRNSPLWEEIRANGGQLLTCQQVMHPAQLEDPKIPELQPDTKPAAVTRPQRSSPLHLFARKVYSLMSRRLRELCSILDIPDELRLKIWTCFEYSLVHCSHLMVDCHLDQSLMCAIYIIAKITKVEIPFKHIMRSYKSQPNARKGVCSNVLISGRNMDDPPNTTGKQEDYDIMVTPNTPSTHYPGASRERRGNLIDFYNQVYTTSMQHFAEQFAPTSGGDTPPLSPYPHPWKASPRRHQVLSNPSIYISPYNPEIPSARTTGLCYYFNASPPQCLREINNMIKTGRSPTRRRYPAKLEEEEEEEEGDQSPLAKRLRLDGQSAWQRRLRSVVNARVARGTQGRPSLVTKPKLH